MAKGDNPLMDQINAGMRSEGFDTDYDGHTVSVKKFAPKAPPKAKPAEKRPSNYQEVMDEKKRAKEDKAPTTKTEMGKPFKKGGSVKGWGKARGARKCKVM